MKNENSFFQSVCTLAVPVALQFMLQASFSIIDQIMIGQLGSVSVAALGLAAKFSSVFTFLVSAIGAVAGVMLSQYMGQKNRPALRRSFFLNLQVSLALAGVFTILCLFFPRQIMGLYTSDPLPAKAAASYLFLIAGTFFPIAGATLLATLLRCMDKAALPLYASIFAAVLNTGLNYILIFGKWGLPAMGTSGAALATLLSQAVNFLMMFLLFHKYQAILARPAGDPSSVTVAPETVTRRQYAAILLPVLICEFMWNLGENVYVAIYGHLGTDACAAMTLMNPVQGLMIGALCGLSQASGILIGRKLGSGAYDEAYRDSKRLLYYGLITSLPFSVLIVLTRTLYVSIYQVSETVRLLTTQILIAYAVIAPFKIQNMILGGGIVRSGGKTRYIMIIDLIGTWGFGVPLGLLSAFVFRLPVAWVYFILSLEECVRYAITVVVFRRRNWMQKL